MMVNKTGDAGTHHHCQYTYIHKIHIYYCNA